MNALGMPKSDDQWKKVVITFLVNTMERAYLQSKRYSACIQPTSIALLALKAYLYTGKRSQLLKYFHRPL